MMTPVEAHRRRFRPDDALLSFLKASALLLWKARFSDGTGTIKNT
jgi:hypothetical protein